MGVGETMNEVSNEVFEGGRMAVDEGTDSGFSGWEWAFVEVRNDTLLIDA